jgi:deazaflavin-dependent oxidoreductase (nitroreductase family)
MPAGPVRANGLACGPAAESCRDHDAGNAVFAHERPLPEHGTVRDRLMPAWMPAVNKRVVNPVQRLWAPWLPPWALVVHRGRRSGAEYRTPVLAWRSGAALYIVLYYGSRAEWVRNVVAAGGGEVVRRGRREPIASVRIERGRAAPLPRIVRGVGLGLPVLVAGLAQRT